MLADLLETLAVEEVSGFDTVRLLEAAYRQLSHVRAVFLSILWETGLRRPGSVTTVQRTKAPNEFACEEARAALVWSRARAASTYGFATDVFDRLAVLGEAMLAGTLDEPRARAFVEWTQGLTDAQAETVCEQLLPEAAGLMVGELIDRSSGPASRLIQSGPPRSTARRCELAAWLGPEIQTAPRILAAISSRSTESPPLLNTSTLWPARASGPGTSA
jgi:hypothetical protein